MLYFFPYKSKIAPPHRFSLCSSALMFCYIRPKGQTYGLLACLLANDCRRLVIPCQLLLPVFRIFLQVIRR